MSMRRGENIESNKLCLNLLCHFKGYLGNDFTSLEICEFFCSFINKETQVSCKLGEMFQKIFLIEPLQVTTSVVLHLTPF